MFEEFVELAVGLVVYRVRQNVIGGLEGNIRAGVGLKNCECSRGWIGSVESELGEAGESDGRGDQYHGNGDRCRFATQTNAGPGSHPQSEQPDGDDCDSLENKIPIGGAQPEGNEVCGDGKQSERGGYFQPAGT